jgi:hypothetical protein
LVVEVFSTIFVENIRDMAKTNKFKIGLEKRITNYGIEFICYRRDFMEKILIPKRRCNVR